MHEASPAPAPQRFSLSLDDRSYVRKSGLWTHDGQGCTENVASRLDARLIASALVEDAPTELREAALTIASDRNRTDDALTLCEGLLRTEPQTRKYRAVLTSLLRRKGRPLEAVDRAAPWMADASPALLTSVGAAFRELGRHEESKATLSRSIAMQDGKADPETLAAWRLLKKEKPSLWSKKGIQGSQAARLWTAPTELDESGTYTRTDVQRLLGGELITYLPQSEGKILAACLNRALNPNAPAVVQVGNKPGVVKKAILLSRQQEAIHVFMKAKEQDTEYAYVGRYRCIGSTKDPEEIAAAERISGRNGELAMLLRLERVEVRTDSLPAGKS